MKKRILSIVLCLSLFVATFATTMVVSAAGDIDEATGYCAEIKEYREKDNFTAPTKENKVFAGWYEDAEFKTAIAPSKLSGEAYAKFVDPTVFTIKNQFNTAANTMSETADLRIITTLDSEWYADIEFVLTVEGLGKAKLSINTIYTSLVNYESAADAFCADSKFFAVEKVTGIPAEYFDNEIAIAAKYTTYDGTVFDGTTREDVVFTEKLPVAEITVDAQNGLGFTTTGTDSFATGVMTPIEGGIYVNGTLSETATLEKTAANTYVINGVSKAADTIVKVEGKYGTATHFADIFVAYAYEGGSWDRWAMAKTKFVGLKPFAEVFGEETYQHGKYLACSIAAENVKGANTWYSFMGLYSIAGGVYTETAGVKTKAGIEIGLDSTTYGANLHIDSRSVALPNAVVEGTILTFTGVIGNAGLLANETPILVEGVSFVFKNGQWNTYVPARYDVEYTLTPFAITNMGTAADKTLVASITASNGTVIKDSNGYYPVEGGIYVNDSKVPMDNYVTVSGGHLYIWSANPAFGFIQTGKEIAIEEGTRIIINGVYGNPDEQDAYFKISNAEFMFLDGKWVNYTQEVDASIYNYGTDYSYAELRFKNSFPSSLGRNSLYDCAGGIYVGDSTTPIRNIELVSLATGIYYMSKEQIATYLGSEYTYTYTRPNGKQTIGVVEGTKITIRGVFRATTSTNDVIYINHTYVHNGCEWQDYTE